MVRQALKAGAKVAKADARASATVAPPSASAPVVNGNSPKEEVPQGTADLAVGSVVTWAVKCLYQEEVLPRGPVLQWFLSVVLGVKMGHKDLRNLIDAEDGIRVEPPGSRKMNFHAVLEEDPPGFNGFVTDSEVAEKLTEEHWEEAAICLSQGGWPKADDIAHKYYVVASWLQDVSDKFRSWSFGRVLIVVRFAAQQDCLLGHRAGYLVPYEHSEECERRVNAQTGLPTHVQDGEAYVKNWEELQQCLHQLLQESAEGKDYYPPVYALEVSKLKWMFRTRLKTELSETVFGHECLSKLLADERLGEDFVLEMCQGNRYMLRRTGGAEKKGNRHDAKKADVPSHLPPPPGLSLLEPGDDDFAPPPGLHPLDVKDLASWPTPTDAAKAETPVQETVKRKPGYGDAVKSLEPPPGLTPEKTHQNQNRHANKVPPAGPGPGPPASNKKAERIWTRI